MSQLQEYTKVGVYVNGAQLIEEAEVKLSRNSGLMPVVTVAKGFSGFSRGASFCEIDISGSVPNAGFEYDSGADQDAGNIVQITLVAGGKTFTSNGFISGDDISHGVNAETKLNIKFHGEFAQWT